MIIFVPMKRCYCIVFIYSILLFSGFSVADIAAADKDVFIAGIDDAAVTFSPSYNKEFSDVLTVNSHGKTFKVMFSWNGSNMSLVCKKDGGSSQYIYDRGKIVGNSVVPFRYPEIGIVGGKDIVQNRYLIATHDFTNDGNPDLLLAVNDGGDGYGIFIFDYNGSAWMPVGEIVTKGKGLGGCRIFRQAVTLKDKSGVMYSWTCRGSYFEFLSSNHNNDASALF